MRFRTISKTCLGVLCLLLHFAASGSPQDFGATFCMKEIKLTQGLVALVDDEDFEYLNQWKWHAHREVNNIYAFRTPKYNEVIRMHRVVLNVTDKNIEVDHRDRNGLNNQKYNLRKATHAQNGANRRPSKNSTSKYLGVYWSRERNRWCASISKNYKTYLIGRFITEEEAALAYNKKAIELHGEFANLNQI